MIWEVSMNQQNKKFILSFTAFFLSLTVLAYNLKRVINILGVPTLVAAVT